jgi:hypothetical protein
MTEHRRTIGAGAAVAVLGLLAMKGYLRRPF